MRKKKIDIQEEWLRPEVLTFKIPTRILQGLGIERANTKIDSSMYTNSPSPVKNDKSR